MNQDEKKLAERLRKALAPHGHFQRIEPFNDKGIPDVNYYTSRGEEFWLELKARANKDLSIRIRKEQFAWGQKRSLLGGNVAVVAAHQDDPSRLVIHKFPFRETERKVLASGIVVKRKHFYRMIEIDRLDEIL